MPAFNREDRMRHLLRTLWYDLHFRDGIAIGLLAWLMILSILAFIVQWLL